MKKLFVLGAFSILSLASCKKDHTCTCATTTAGVSSTSSFTITDTKKDAEAKCDEGDASSSILGVTSTVDCSLK
jgi:hypothetical protein